MISLLRLSSVDFLKIDHLIINLHFWKGKVSHWRTKRMSCMKKHHQSDWLRSEFENNQFFRSNGGSISKIIFESDGQEQREQLDRETKSNLKRKHADHLRLIPLTSCRWSEHAFCFWQAVIIFSFHHVWIWAKRFSRENCFSHWNN